MGAHPQRKLVAVRSAKQKAFHVEREMTRNKGRREIRHTSLRSETCGPIVAPASAARRGRRHGVRADVDTGTRKVKVIT